MQSRYLRTQSPDLLKHVVAGLAPMEASERSLVAQLPFLPALAVSAPSMPSALVLFLRHQSERLRVKFDVLHAALQRSADQSPGFTCGDQVEKPFFLFRRPAYPRHYAVISSPLARARPGGGWLPDVRAGPDAAGATRLQAGRYPLATLCRSGYQFQSKVARVIFGINLCCFLHKAVIPKNQAEGKRELPPRR